MLVKKKKKLYVIGDSISLHYEPYLKDFIAEYFDYNRKGEEKKLAINSFERNGGDSSMVLSFLQSLVSDGFKTDFLMLNCGLHDIKVKDSNDAQCQISAEDYRKNLNKIAELAKKSADVILWITTTPVDDEQHKKHSYSFHRFNANVIEYNEIANEVFTNIGAEILDLYTFTSKLGKELHCDHVHFDDSIRELQGALISGYLLSLYNK